MTENSTAQEIRKRQKGLLHTSTEDRKKCAFCQQNKEPGHAVLVIIKLLVNTKIAPQSGTACWVVRLQLATEICGTHKTKIFSKSRPATVNKTTGRVGVKGGWYAGL
mgnify:CR=1 FL=1